MLGKLERNARHLYDIYKIAPHVIVNEEFRALVEEVREHRKQMGQDIAPAVLLTSSNVVKRGDEIAEKDYYKAEFQCYAGVQPFCVIELELALDF